MSAKNEYDRKTLYEEIWTQPVSTVAKRYSVSDVALRKVCVKLNIPMPQRGYWAKLAAGHTVEKTPLPDQHDGLETIVGRRTSRWSCGNKKVDAMDINDDRKAALAKAIACAQQVDISSMELDAQIRRHLERLHKWIEQQSTRVSGRPLLSKTVSPSQYVRSLKIIQVIGTTLSHIDGKLGNDLEIHIEGERIPYTILEGSNRELNTLPVADIYPSTSKRAQLPRTKVKKWITEPNGRLSFAVMKRRYIRDDHKGGIESKLEDILIALVNAIPMARAKREEHDEGMKEISLVTSGLLSSKQPIEI